MTEKEYQKLKVWFKLRAAQINREGYGEIKAKDIENYYKKLAWKRSFPKYYYQQVAEILAVQSNAIFDYLTLNAQVYAVQPLSDMDIHSLF